MKKRLFLLGFIILLIVFGALYVAGQKETVKEKEIKEFTAFFDTPNEIVRSEDNEIKELIAQKLGAKCQEIWLVGQTADEAIASYIASGEYPDFISGDVNLYEAGALVPIDEYWDDYPNIKNYMSAKEWDRYRREDGHIYWIPQFGIVKRESAEVIHEGEAFWIQTRVLKWAGYPEIRTVEQYFALIEDYMIANPLAEDGQENIPFMILCDDWRYFCLENPPQFLAGYPNDGSCMVDTETLTVLDYSSSETAKEYFKLLNTQYHKGLIATESFTQSYREYLDRLLTGRVLGMVDQWWQFAYDVNATMEKMTDLGCGYVPLPITMSESIENQWHVKRGNELSVASGVSVTIGCDDVEGAMAFLNGLLEDEIIKLRYWGIEGVDYEIDENGVYYRTPKQRVLSRDVDYDSTHYCMYEQFPRFEGMLEDGINAFSPEYQPREFMESLPQDVKECFEAYGCESYVDMLGTNEQPGPWYPMYSYSDTLTSSQPAGRVWKEMTDVKKTYLPQVIMTDDFETMWQTYMDKYRACEPEIFLEDMQRELQRRIAASKE